MLIDHQKLSVLRSKVKHTIKEVIVILWKEGNYHCLKKEDILRHQLTREERSKGGKTRSQQESFPTHCENAYQMLLIKRPDVAKSIYKYRVKPYMEKRYGNG